MGMIVGRRWTYSKIGNAWEYYISKRSIFKYAVKTVLDCIAMTPEVKMSYDTHTNRKYIIVKLVDINSKIDIDYIDNAIIYYLIECGCKKSLAKIKTMKGEGECIVKK